MDNSGIFNISFVCFHIFNTFMYFISIKSSDIFSEVEHQCQRQRCNALNWMPSARMYSSSVEVEGSGTTAVSIELSVPIDG